MKIPNISEGRRDLLAAIANINTMGTLETIRDKRSATWIGEPNSSIGFNVIKSYEGRGITTWRLKS